MNRRRLLMSSNSGDGRFMIGNYEVVDLNLPSGLLWATCNVGANEETDYGDYYMYGKGSQKYNSSDSAYKGTEDPLASSADTTTQVMGSGWRMPTRAEFLELINNTNYEWVTNFNESGVNGCKITSKTNPNAYVFFPAAGYYISRSREADRYNIYTWSSTPYYDEDDNEYSLKEAYTLKFSYGAGYELYAVEYSRGCSVRGVISGGG